MLATIVVVQTVAILALAALLVWSERSHEQAMAELVAGFSAEIRILSDKLVHHLTTARKEGYAFQPVDEPFDPYRITPEMEADLEGRE